MQHAFKIFIVEDDPWYGEILEYHLSLNPDFSITRFATGKELLANMHKNPDLITMDFSLPDYTGDALFQKIREINETIPVIIISGQEQISVVVNLLKQGVSDYIVKDDNTKDFLWNSIVKIRETGNLKKEVEFLRKELGQKYSFDKIIKGQSPAIERVFGLMEKAIKTNINVYVTGETGTGKELVAKGIHYNSDRSKKNFVEVNMAAIPETLIESELFGHEQGAFTGAVGRKKGKFEEANGGTIFLDEIAELNLNMQSKLLRVLQEREVVRVGGNEKIKLDVRIIVATHKNLSEEVQQGRFREDLYYRVMGLPIQLPPLRERGNDILILAKFFLDGFTKENNLPPVNLSAAAKDKIMRYNYPGNVRELKAVTELAAVLCSNNEINPDDITFSAPKEESLYTLTEKTLREYDCEIIRHYLKKYQKDVTLVAKKLDIGRSTIYKLLQEKEIVLQH